MCRQNNLLEAVLELVAINQQIVGVMISVKNMGIVVKIMGLVVQVKKGFVVKTMESPRDLRVPDKITQYTALDGSMANTSDILLLVRPDYTIFDEMRRSRDFEVFADMRLAGVGMIGVVHSARAIDALQRLIGRLDLGTIPQVVDTIIFIPLSTDVSNTRRRS